jgi:hypothetical protein
MPTDALPGERHIVFVETLKDFESQLESRKPIDNGMFDAISMLVADAILVGDVSTLNEATSGFRRIYFMLTTLPATSNTHQAAGRVHGYRDVVAWAQWRMIPRQLQEQIQPGGLNRQLLELIGSRRGILFDVMVSELADIPSKINQALQFLVANHLVTSCHLVDELYEISPRGREALHLTRP